MKSWWWRTWNSSIGMKMTMAVTGAALIAFVIAHLLGNLQIYLGADVLNDYAKKLKSIPAVLWTFRLGLLALFAIHVLSAIRLTRMNRAARSEKYAVQRPVQVGIAPRMLLLSGLVVLAFVVYHLLHFTAGVTDPSHFALHDASGRHDVYSMVVLGFSQPVVSGAYIVAMLLLGMHLTHGIASVFQTLGLNEPKYRPLLTALGPVLAWLLVAGNISIPLSVLLGLVGLPPGGPS